MARLGIPKYDWWNEALHGVARAGEATVFPQAIGLAAMWDEAFMQQVAHTSAIEARAKFNGAVGTKNEGTRYFGLTFWTPNINIFRDPRWGRGQETYGEDPFLTSRNGLAFVRGLQGRLGTDESVLATAKHFIGDGGTHLHTFHPTGGSGSAQYFHDAPWLDFNLRQNGHGATYTGRYAKTREDYERLLEAQNRSDAPGAESAAKAMEARIRLEAKTIAESYLAPPHTTDFAILFLPVEGLYAEVLRRPGLMDSLQRDYRVTLAGPTTLLAMLNSLHMGFRTLALEQQASEVWKVLGAVKTEFERYGDWVEKVREQVQKAADTLDRADTRSRQMRRALKNVEALPEGEAQALLPKFDDALDDTDAKV